MRSGQGDGPATPADRPKNPASFRAPPMIHVHGIKATSLVDRESGEMGYGSTAAFFNLCSPDFTPRAEWTEGGAGPQAEDGWTVGGMIEDLEVPMPMGTTLRLLQVQSPYTEFCRERAARLRTTFDVFLYDWRREIPESTGKLERFLETVVAGAGGRPAQLLCHSMGAIVALPLLAKRPELIHSVLFIAPGVHMDIGFLEDCSVQGMYSPPRNHNNTVFNSTMLSPTMWATCPAPHSFFPIGGGCATDGLPPLVRPDGTPIEFDFYKLEDWKKHKLGVYHPHSGVDVTPELEDFMREMFRRCERFRRGILDLDLRSAPPVRCLMSLCKDTPIGYVVDEETGPRWREGRIVKGDGRVSCHAIATPPGGLRYLEVVASPMSHFQVQNDTARVEVLLDKLLADGEAYAAAAGVADSKRLAS